MPIQNPVIVVPGITASQLRDEYPVTPDIVWSAVLNKEYDRITLHPDDLRYEIREPSRITADALFELPYSELVSELRHNLTTRADRPVPVYPFPYDWRLPLEKIDALLDKFIQEVIARTALMKHYHRAGYTAESGRVDLVGHSMGGLIITGISAEHKGQVTSRQGSDPGYPVPRVLRSANQDRNGHGDAGHGGIFVTRARSGTPDAGNLPSAAEMAGRPNRR